MFLYALRRDVVLDLGLTSDQERHHCFYTPFGVTWFWTHVVSSVRLWNLFLYALRRDVVLDNCSPDGRPGYRFYTPFGVTWFWTQRRAADAKVLPVSIRPSA